MQPTDQHWQADLTTVSKRISYLRTSPKWADLTINFPEHKKSIKVHKWMLALSSPVLEAMMFGPLAEGEVVSLPDDPPKAFEWLLDYLYCDQRYLPDMEMAIDVFKLAHKYQIPELCRLCSVYLCLRVNPDNLPLLYSMAYTFEDDTLLKCCEKILPTKSAEVLQSNEVSKLSCSALKHLLENKKLNPSSSLVVFKCIHAWGKVNLGRLASDSLEVEGGPEAAEESGEAADMSSLPHNIRQCVESLLPLVDFLSLSIDEFVEHVLPTGIFTLEENMSMLQGIKDVPDIVLPSCVRPRAVKSMLLVDSTSINRSYIPLNDCNESFCDIQTSHTIRLLQIEVHFRDIYPEGELLIKSNENEVVGKAVYCQPCCRFEIPVQLKPGKQFRFVYRNNSRATHSSASVNGRHSLFGQSDSVSGSLFSFGQSNSGRESKTVFGQADSGRESKSHFGQSDSGKESKSVFGQSDSGKESKSVFGQSDSGKESKSVFGQSDFGKESKSLVGQSDSGKESKSVFGQSDFGKESKSLVGQADSGKESKSLFGQADSGREKQFPSWHLASVSGRFSFGQADERQSNFPHPLLINAESEGIKITGNARDDVKKLLVKYSILNK